MFDQAEFEVRCEWGVQGIAHLAPISDVVIVVDVLSFSTCVDVAVSRGAVVYPYRGSVEAAVEFAASVGAELAYAGHSPSGYALSPPSLLAIAEGTRIVLPSPNGSTLTLETGATPTLAGCLRNRRAVAAAAQKFGRRVAVIPAGERWRADRSLRPSFEDWVGAGAMIECLPGSLSPEARAALAAFRDAESDLARLMAQCSSGKELIARERGEDVRLAAALDVSEFAPLFREGAYRRTVPV